MRTPFEDSLAAALQARLAGGDPSLTPAGLARDELVIDLPAGGATLDHGELADAIASALDELLSDSTLQNRGQG